MAELREDILSPAHPCEEVGRFFGDRVAEWWWELPICYIESKLLRLRMIPPFPI